MCIFIDWCKTFICILGFLMILIEVNAQVSINTDGSAPRAGTLLDVKANKNLGIDSSFVVTDRGYVGIGTINPAAQLEVRTNFYLGGTSNTQLRIGSHLGNGSGNAIDFNTTSIAGGFFIGGRIAVFREGVNGQSTLRFSTANSTGNLSEKLIINY